MRIFLLFCALCTLSAASTDNVPAIIDATGKTSALPVGNGLALPNTGPVYTRLRANAANATIDFPATSTLAGLQLAQTFSGADLFTGGVTLTTNGLTLTDVNVGLGTITGTILGTSTLQKLGFWNATPVVQQTGDVATALATLGLVTAPTISATTGIDGTFRVIGSGDATKKLAFEVDAQTTGKTLTIDTGAQTVDRTLTIPVLTGDRTVAVIDQAQTFSAAQSISDTTDATTTTTGSLTTLGGISYGTTKSLYGGLTKMADGTAGAPAYSFTSDPTSGVYLAAANTVGITANSSVRLSVDSAGVSTFGTLTTGSGAHTFNGASTFTSSITGNSTITGSVSQNSLYTLLASNTNSGNAAAVRLRACADVSTNCSSIWQFSSAYATTVFGVANPFNYGGLIARGTTHAGLFIGEQQSNAPIIFGGYDGASEVELARFTSGVVATGGLSIKYTTDATNTTTGSLTTAGGLSWGTTKSAYGGSVKLAGGTAAAPAYSIDGDTNTGMYSDFADLLKFTTAGSLRMTIASTGITVSGQILPSAGTVSLPSHSFSGDADTGLYSVSANVMGTATNGALRADVGNTLANYYTGFNISPTAVATPVATDRALSVRPANHTALTASTEYISLAVNGATQQFATGSLATERYAAILAPTFSFVGASTITNAATFAILGAPVAGTNATITNSYSFWVGSGKSQFDGTIGLSDTTDSTSTTTGSFTSLGGLSYGATKTMYGGGINLATTALIAQEVGIGPGGTTAGTALNVTYTPNMTGATQAAIQATPIYPVGVTTARGISVTDHVQDVAGTIPSLVGINVSPSVKDGGGAATVTRAGSVMARQQTIGGTANIGYAYGTTTGLPTVTGTYCWYNDSADTESHGTGQNSFPGTTDATNTTTGTLTTAGGISYGSTKSLYGGAANFASNVTLSTAGSGVLVKEGSNATMGTAVLVGGTVVVSTTKVTANSRIFLTVQTSGGTVGSEYISARTAATSFTITSTSGSDTSTVAWFIVEPAP